MIDELLARITVQLRKSWSEAKENDDVLTFYFKHTANEGGVCGQINAGELRYYES